MKAALSSLILFVLCSGLSPVLGQSFEIVDRTPDAGNAWLNLDASTLVTFEVVATGNEGLVVPKLVPVGPFADSVVATWRGTQPTSNLSNLTFDVHLYNEPALCEGSISFELYFFSDSFGAPILATATNNSWLDLQVRDQNTTLTHEIVSTSPGLPWPLSGSGQSTHFLNYNVLSPDILLNPSNHIYFWSDYNLNGAQWNQQFLFFLYSLDNSGCALGTTTDLNFSQLVTSNVIDQTGSVPEAVSLAPPGGAGVTSAIGQGINIFDVTDVDPADSDCANTVRESIAYQSGLAQLVWSYAGVGMVVRRFALYVGQPACQVLNNNFGTAPSGDFWIDEVFFSSAGEVSAHLNVPSSWGNSSQLNSNMRLQWYLRSDSRMVALGSETRNLNLNTVTDGNIDPGTYFLEARIRRTDSNAVVSLDNRGVNAFNYSFEDVSFTNAESGGPDAYFDPGESLNIHYRVDSSASLPTLTYDSGFAIDANGNDQLEPDADAYPTPNLPSEGGVNIRVGAVQASGSGGTRNLTIPFEMLTVRGQDSLWFFADVSSDQGGVLVSYRQYFSLRDILGGEYDINAEDTDMAYDFDFEGSSHSTDGWTPVNDVSSATSGGWTYDSGAPGPWRGDGGQSVDNADDLYRLESPVWSLGHDSFFSFTHQTGFTENASAGMLEYRSREAGETWSDWSNYISEHCAACGHYDGSFPSSRGSYFDGQNVWMAADSAPELINLDIPTAVEFPSDNGEIQFRFIFGDPSLGDPTAQLAPTSWDVLNFSYQTTRLIEDNVFGVVTDDFPLVGCDNAQLTFHNWAPVGVSDLTFVWYESLADLWSDNGTAPITGSLGAFVPFSQEELGVYTYYVRISHNGVERVIEMSIDESTGITSGQAMLQILTSAESEWPSSTNILPYVGIINTVCPEE